MGEELVTCGRCGETKPRSAFYDLRHTTQPRRPCKTCISETRRTRYSTNGGDGTSHAQVLREKYQLTPADYAAMLAGQGGTCAICHREETVLGRGGTPRRLAVDHDPRSGKVRQLLCHRCNLVTWAVADNPDLLDAVHAYLTRHR